MAKRGQRQQQQQRRSHSGRAEVSMETTTTTMAMAVAVLLLAAGMQKTMWVQAACTDCKAWALFVIEEDDTLYILANRFSVPTYTVLQTLNNITDPDVVEPGQRIRIPFTCDCNGMTLFHKFSYAVVQGDDAQIIAATKFNNLTTADAINSANPGASMQAGTTVWVPVNCSCGDATISKDYCLFATYAAQPGDTLFSLSNHFDISQQLLREYNPTVSFDPLQPFSSILFIPMRNSSGQCSPLVTSQDEAGTDGLSKGTVIGVAMGIVAFIFVLGLGLRFLWARRITKPSGKERGSHVSEDVFALVDRAPHKLTEDNNIKAHGMLQVGCCVQFAFDDLVVATDNFSVSREIGKGGFATVFYGEWQEKKVAVKRMESTGKREFMSELMVLSSVHHVNVVDLLGFCATEAYLFLVYEYMENETLAHHLRFGEKPLQWETRVQIALDAARGVEYIHEHSTPIYIHRDLKPSNILLDSKFRAKVGDFGLTKLIDPEGDGWTNTTSAFGTFGYMAPEYAQFGKISVKIDVYAFGVILFQLVSGREALDGSSRELPSLFQGVLESNDDEPLMSLIDPALGTVYSLESVRQMVNLATRCTEKEAELRPVMREVVFQLVSLSEMVSRVNNQAQLGASQGNS